MGMVLGGSGEPVSAVYAEEPRTEQEIISNAPVVPSQGEFGFTGNTWQSLEMYRAVIIVICC